MASRGDVAGQRRRYRAKYRERDRAKNNRLREKQRRKRWAALAAIKLEQGCADCGYREAPEALQFDHRVPAEKEFSLAHGHVQSWARVLAEVEKCDVRCANCHAIRTKREGHYTLPAEWQKATAPLVLFDGSP